MHVLVELESEDRATICAIFESEPQAQRALDPDSNPTTQVVQWPSCYQPRLGETVQIGDGMVTSHNRQPFQALTEEIFKKSKITELLDRNATLVQRISGLEQRLENKPAFLGRDDDRTPTARQTRDIWSCDDQKQAVERIVADYVKSEKPTLNQRMMLVPDEAAADQLNRLAQDNRIEGGYFDPTRGMAHNHVLLHKGDRVQFLRDDADLGVKDGELGEIVQLFQEHRAIVVAGDRRNADQSEFVIVPLEEYSEIDLAYAATYERSRKMDLYQVFVLADLHAPTREFVDSLTCFRAEVYADLATAYTQFADYLQGQKLENSIDRDADPLGIDRNRD